MQIGAVIGLFLALLFVCVDHYRGSKWAKRVTESLPRGRIAVYHVSRGKTIITLLLGISGGAIVGWLVS